MTLSFHFRRHCYGRADIPTLGTLVAAAQKQDQHLPTLHEVQPVSRAVIDAQLRYPVSDRLHVPEQSAFEAHDALGNPPRSLSIGQVFQPTRENNSLTNLDLL
jgi:hypothetical protein